MKATLKFVTLPSPDTPGCTLVLTFDDKRYLFGHIGEGTQRAIVERKSSLRHISHLYLTGRCEWRTIGGIVGQALTLIDQEHSRNEVEREEQFRKEQGLGRTGKVEFKKGGSGFQGREHRRELTFRGPENLAKMMATTRFFVFRTAMPVNVEEALDGREWANDHMIVKALKTYPTKETRKRSYEDFASAQRSDQHDSIIKSVVNGIFGSTWTMDTGMDEIRDIPTGDENLPSEDEENIKAAKLAHMESREGKNSKGKDRAPWPASVMQRLPVTEPSEASVSYLIKMREQRGKFLPHKALELGVTPGPDFSKLTKGENVVTPAGVTVTPEQVMGPSRPGGGFALLDIPEERYIENTLAKLEDPAALEGLNLVVWVLGKGLADHPLVLEFMKKHTALEHVITPDMESNTSISFNRFAGAQTRLGLIAPDTFPLSLHDERLPSVSEDKPYKLANLDLNYEFHPNWTSFEQRDIPVFNQVEEIEKAQLVYKELAKEAHMATLALEDETPLEDIVGKDTEIITLGTGSSLPSLYRNVSATLVLRPNNHSLLLDAGENTMGQLRRLFTPPQLTEVLRGLKCIYISHLHADHQLGTAGVIKSWYAAVHNSVPSTPSQVNPAIYRSRSSPPPESDPEGTLYVIAPSRFRTWLQEYQECEDFGLSRVSFISLETVEKYSNPYGFADYPLPPQLADPAGLGMDKIRTCFARHCQSSFCSMYSFTDGFKLAYSGDTRPIDRFAELAKGTTVLVHEATFDDELMKEAIAKRHSTTTEAIDMGRAMQAKYTLLTHFSQRYPKVPELGEAFSSKPKAIEPAVARIAEKSETETDENPACGLPAELTEPPKVVEELEPEKKDDTVAQMPAETSEPPKVAEELETEQKKEKPVVEMPVESSEPLKATESSEAGPLNESAQSTVTAPYAGLEKKDDLVAELPVETSQLPKTVESSVLAQDTETAQSSEMVPETESEKKDDTVAEMPIESLEAPKAAEFSEAAQVTETTKSSETVPEKKDDSLAGMPSEFADLPKMGVGISFDLMRIKVGQLRRFGNWWDALKEVFKEEEEVVADIEPAEDVNKAVSEKPKKQKAPKQKQEPNLAKAENKRRMKEESKRRKQLEMAAKKSVENLKKAAEAKPEEKKPSDEVKVDQEKASGSMEVDPEAQKTSEPVDTEEKKPSVEVKVVEQPTEQKAEEKDIVMEDVKAEDTVIEPKLETPKAEENDVVMEDVKKDQQ
ncbi:hypothetical protein BJ508DRAFT_411254 [Ascobolus immersus RN42]|uniref:ribonuclease Z n=1 Tax=Ascobolus immersus RN42 TaxID=1160509 RepID=A0A3N4IKB4_ASCIM|nr:hypothetical protein BJ508DRAFT_411254 [Ascobolus immersus RN42]